MMVVVSGVSSENMGVFLFFFFFFSTFTRWVGSRLTKSVSCFFTFILLRFFVVEENRSSLNQTGQLQKLYIKEIPNQGGYFWKVVREKRNVNRINYSP